MTRKECEQKILEKVQEIDAIVKEYNPDNSYLSMCVTGGHISVNNTYWDKDSSEHKFPIYTYVDVDSEDQEPVSLLMPSMR